eukprot:COSAG02_NODE_51_length_44689_cov_29.477361_15_plen_149_part_00
MFRIISSTHYVLSTNHRAAIEFTASRLPTPRAIAGCQAAQKRRESHCGSLRPIQASHRSQRSSEQCTFACSLAASCHAGCSCTMHNYRIPAKVSTVVPRTLRSGVQGRGPFAQIVAAILQKHPDWFPTSVPHQPRIVMSSTDVCKSWW